jgi:Domain of unknown function (DUF5916)
VKDIQPHGTVTDSTAPFATHYTFARLDQNEASLTGRIDYTVSPTLTVQLYAQPFVSKGTYSNLRELADPRAAAYADRYKPYTGSPDGFNRKQFNSTAVLRWEYRPGSTLFVVWTQGRQLFLDAAGTRSMGREFRDLFDLHPDNTFLVKASYWLNW